MHIIDIDTAAQELIAEHPEWGPDTHLATIYDAIRDKYGIERPMTRQRIRVRTEQALRLIGEDGGDIER